MSFSYSHRETRATSRSSRRGIGGPGLPRDSVRKLLSSFWSLAPRQIAYDLPFSHTLQMDGRSSDDADGVRIDELPGTCMGAFKKPSERASSD